MSNPIPDTAPRQRRRWIAAISSFFSSAVALIALKCPFCIPALGALLTAMGVTFFAGAALVHWTLVALLLLNVFALGISARQHGRWWIAVAGLIGAAAVYASRYLWASDSLLWIGAIILISASIVNLRARRTCPQCAPAASL